MSMLYLNECNIVIDWFKDFPIPIIILIIITNFMTWFLWNEIDDMMVAMLSFLEKIIIVDNITKKIKLWIGGYVIISVGKRQLKDGVAELSHKRGCGG